MSQKSEGCRAILTHFALRCTFILVNSSDPDHSLTKRVRLQLRKAINDRPILGYSLLVAMVTAAAVMAYLAFGDDGTREPPTLSFFSVDDGQTYFSADKSNYPPFQHEGQTAFAAVVFECDGERFVGYLERYVPALRAELEAMGDAPLNADFLRRAANGGMEVKRPGDDTWVSNSDPEAYNRIVSVMCPGSSKRAEPVFP